MSILQESDIMPQLNLKIYYDDMFSVYHFLRNETTGGTKRNFDTDVLLPTYSKCLQRGLVWNDSQKNGYILSLLRGIKPSPIAVIERFHLEYPDDSRDFEVIDGKQRIHTISSFINHEYCFTHNGISYSFSQLSDGLQRKLLSTHIPTFRIDEALLYMNQKRHVTDDEKIMWFDYLNSQGTPQDMSHIQSLRKLIEK